jgi:hypothetical protein
MSCRRCPTEATPSNRTCPVAEDATAMPSGVPAATSDTHPSWASKGQGSRPPPHLVDHTRSIAAGRPRPRPRGPASPCDVVVGTPAGPRRKPTGGDQQGGGGAYGALQCFSCLEFDRGLQPWRHRCWQGSRRGRLTSDPGGLVSGVGAGGSATRPRLVSPVARCRRRARQERATSSARGAPHLSISSSPPPPARAGPCVYIYACPWHCPGCSSAQAPAHAHPSDRGAVVAAIASRTR